MKKKKSRTITSKRNYWKQSTSPLYLELNVEPCLIIVSLLYEVSSQRKNWLCFYFFILRGDLHCQSIGSLFFIISQSSATLFFPSACFSSFSFSSLASFESIKQSSFLFFFLFLFIFIFPCHVFIYKILFPSCRIIQVLLLSSFPLFTFFRYVSLNPELNVEFLFTYTI